MDINIWEERTTMKKMLSLSLLFGLTAFSGGFVFAEMDGRSPSPASHTGSYDARGTDIGPNRLPDTDGGGLSGYSMRNSPNNPRTNYPGDYWDRVRSYRTGSGGARAYSAADTTSSRNNWGWLGLLGLVGLAGKARKERTH